MLLFAPYFGTMPTNTFCERKKIINKIKEINYKREVIIKKTFVIQSISM